MMKFCTSGFKLKTKGILFFAYLIVCMQFPIQAQKFVRVNSGTKSDIFRIGMLNENEGFFLTDKIYTLNQGVEWEKADYSANRSISLFSAKSILDFWYVTNLENSTSNIYHSLNKQEERITGPFGVGIYAMHVTADNIVFLSSSSEVAVYEGGFFKNIELAPTKAVIKKIVGRNSHLFWILTSENEMFLYSGLKYKRILADKKVKDFVVIDDQIGYALCENEIVTFNGQEYSSWMKSDTIGQTDKLYYSPKGEIWLMGANAKILRIDNGRVEDFSTKEKYSLTDLSFAGPDEVWISGSDGVLLYHGKKNLPVFEQGNPGFTSFKLTNFGIDLDNEYGVGLADLNGDNFIDIFAVCISDFNRIFINKLKSGENNLKGNFFRDEGILRKSQGNFDAKKESNYEELKLGVTVADVDNDGDEDVYLSYLNSRNKLLLNNGNGIFRDVSSQPFRACDDYKRSSAAAFADVDLDGDVDLYVASENGSNKFFINDGTGHFTDITSDAGLETDSWGSCVTFSDINQDGYPDLCVTFWYSGNRIYLNESWRGKIRFREITEQTDLANTPPVKTNGATFADINNDGFPDLFLANKNDENKLYLNNGAGIFMDVTDSYLEKNVYLSNGAVIADFDQDGYQDLYLSNVGTNVLYKNISGLFFKDVTAFFGAEMSGYSTGSGVGDFNNDGNIDIYAANFLGGSSKVFLNQRSNRQTVKLKLEGTHSNRDAIGAKIFLYAKDLVTGKIRLEAFQEISGGGGYASISAKEVIFPLMFGYQYFAIVKFPFPGSEKRIDDLKPGLLLVREEAGLSAYATRLAKSIHRIVKDPEILKEYSKFAILFLLFLIYFRLEIHGDNRISRIRKGSVLVIFILCLFLNYIFIYSTSLLLFFMPIFIAFILLIITHLITDRLQIAEELSGQRLKLREKISRDLHDDLASTLGSISIYSDTLKRMEDPVHSEYRKLSVKIADLTQSALQSITDIIWMTSPRNDSLQGLLAKVNNLMYETFIDNGIFYHADINTPDHLIVLPDELKNDIFLILKEAIHNIIRHAKATSVTFNAEVNDHTCNIVLIDDGVGFDEENLQLPLSHGNGLINIKQRANESKIELSVNSHPGKGTFIHIAFQI